jgi:hypothetical protein
MTYYLTMYTIALPSLVLLKKHKITNVDVARRAAASKAKPWLWRKVPSITVAPHYSAQIRLPDVRAGPVN